MAQYAAGLQPSISDSIRLAILDHATGVDNSALNVEDEDGGEFRAKLKSSPFVRGPSTMTLHRRGRLLNHNITIYRLPSSMVIRDNGSVFDAFVATHPDLTEADVKDVLAEIRSDERIALATHPTIHAYRVRSPSGAIVEAENDDGEDYASRKILRVLRRFHLVGAVLVVTRWYGGVALVGSRTSQRWPSDVETRVLRKKASECSL